MKRYVLCQTTDGVETYLSESLRWETSLNDAVWLYEDLEVARDECADGEYIREVNVTLGDVIKVLDKVSVQ